MRSFSFAVCLIVGGIALFATAPAFAVCDPSNTTEVSCLKAEDSSCSQLGTSMMDKDQKNIIVCLKNDAGTQNVWKSSTSSESKKSCRGNDPASLFHFGDTGNIFSRFSTLENGIISSYGDVSTRITAAAGLTLTFKHGTGIYIGSTGGGPSNPFLYKGSDTHAAGASSTCIDGAWYGTGYW